MIAAPTRPPVKKWIGRPSARAAKAFDRAWTDLMWEGASSRQFCGGIETKCTQLMCRPDAKDFRPTVREAMVALGETYNWTISAETVGAITEHVQRVTLEMEQCRPWFDDKARLAFEAHLNSFAAPAA